MTPKKRSWTTASSTHNKSYTGSAVGKDPHGRCFFFLGGKPLKDIKTRERHDGAELPKTLRHAPKELAQKGLRAAKEKGKEQLQQAAQNGMAV